MSALRLCAPAKLNLGLRVTGRRADGYHGLESLFVPIALADELQLERWLSGVRLTLTGEHAAGVPPDARNLAWRAAEAFARETGLESGVSIALEKRVPSPAGLGGGSSDAGAVLRGLRMLTGRGPYPPTDLARSRSGSAPTCRSSWRPGRRSSRASARGSSRCGGWAR